MANNPSEAQKLMDDSSCLTCIPSGLLGYALLQATLDNGSPTVTLGNVTLNVSDLEIGAVELKDSTTNNRATINAGGELLVSGTIADTKTDDAAFTIGTSKVLPAGYIFTQSGDVLDDGDVGAARVDEKRAQVMVIEDAFTPGQLATVSAAGEVSVLATQSGNWNVQVKDGSGNTINSVGAALNVNVASSGVTLPVALDPVDFEYPEDSAAADGAQGLFMLGVRNDAGANKTDNNGDYSGFSTDAAGRIGIADLGGSITVDAPVATPVFVRLSDGAAAITTLPVSIAGTVAISGSITADIQGDYVDDSAFAVATDRGVAVGGTFTTDSIDAGDFGAFKINAKRELFVVQDTAANLNATVNIAAAQTLATVTTVATVTAVTTVSTVTAVTAITNALPAGTNLLGKVGIDQTTPGTTNKVSLSDETTKVIGTVNQGTSPWVVSGTVTTAEAAPTTIFNGKTSTVTAGTRVVLAASTTVKSVTIKALAANTGTIYVGNATVAAANGFALAAGQSVSMDISNLNTVNIDSSVNAEGVTYLGVN